MEENHNNNVNCDEVARLMSKNNAKNIKDLAERLNGNLERIWDKLDKYWPKSVTILVSGLLGLSSALIVYLLTVK